jgi:TNF receptor-associated factor 6
LKLLNFRKKKSNCPLDDLDLSLEDIFPDNYTKREIENIRKSFPDQFFEPPNVLFECRFSTISCDFKTIEPEELEKHMENASKEHIDLLLSNYLKTQYSAWEPLEKSKNGDKEAFLRQQSTTRDLLNAMYERIVVLEQQNREQAIQIEKLQLMETKKFGTLVWKIEDFRKKIESMHNNTNIMFYSSEAYTNPNEYKFCARINLSHKMRDCLSFHVHLMKSENDFHLSWPFIGRIKISMIHPKESSLTQDDCIMSKPEILAFHRPEELVSPRGFGFTEYAIISDIIKKGFIENDCLVIKIQMNIV